MRRKTVVWAYLVVLSLGTILSLYIPKNEVTAKEEVTIPGDAIRLRILANSDLEADQALKRDVRDAVNAKITVWVKDLTSLKEARKVIVSKLPELQKTAEEVVKREGSTQTVNVKFGKVQFPTKLYGDFLYPAGKYEAVLITLGEGKGANWWCVLFPPLCFLDFSNGVAVSDGFEDKQQKPASVEKAQSASADVPAVQDKQVREAEEPVKAEEEQPRQNKAEAQHPLLKQVQNEEHQAPKSKHVKQEVQKKSVSNGNEQVQEKATGEPRAEVPLPQAKQETVNEAVEGSSVGREQKPPVYTAQDEEPVKVKFFVVELWEKLFD